MANDCRGYFFAAPCRPTQCRYIVFHEAYDWKRLLQIIEYADVPLRNYSLTHTMYLPSLSKVNIESYPWHIENFSEKEFTFYEQSREQSKACGVSALRSPEFTLSLMVNDNLKKVNVCLWLMRDATKAPDGTLTYSSNWMRLDLYEYDCCRPSYPFNHDAVKLTAKPTTYGKNICTASISGRQKERLSKLTGVETACFREHIFTKPEFIRYNDLFDKEKGLVCGDRLSIVCEMHAFTNSASYVDSWLFDPSNTPSVLQDAEHTLKSDLKQLFDTRRNSDVTLIASNGQEFPAHTCMLSSRSTVFAAMFEHNMKEKQENRVNIEDLSSNAVASLLEFIYTDTVPDIATRAQELLFAAHKYDISRLITLCEEVMVSNLKAENAADFFLLVDLHGASQLRKAAMRFTAINLKEVKAAGEWEKLKMLIRNFVMNL